MFSLIGLVLDRRKTCSMESFDLIQRERLQRIVSRLWIWSTNPTLITTQLWVQHRKATLCYPTILELAPTFWATRWLHGWMNTTPCSISVSFNEITLKQTKIMVFSKKGKEQKPKRMSGEVEFPLYMRVYLSWSETPSTLVLVGNTFFFLLLRTHINVRVCVSGAPVLVSVSV